MSALKRFLILSVTVALAFGGLSLGLARAAGSQPVSATALQTGGTAWLGVSIEDTGDGVTVREVTPGSPADEAGLRAGDVITAVDGEPVASAEALVDLIASHAVGDEITVTAEWRGVARDHTVTLGERPADFGQPQPPSVEMAPGMMIGGTFSLFGLTAELTDQGLEIQSLEDDSPFVAAGLQTGDVITQINGVDVTANMGRDLMLALRSDQPLTLTVLRDGEETTIEVDVSGLLGELMPDVELPDINMQPGRGFGFGAMVGGLLGLDAEMTSEGLAINEISEDSPLAGSGLQAGDVVTAVNGVSLTDFEPGAMMGLLGDLTPGGALTLTVLRDGAETTVEITLPDTFQFQFTPGGPGFGFQHGQGRGFGPGMGGMMGSAQPAQLGVRFSVITAALATERGLSVQEGALIEQVYDGTPAAEAGLEAGDIITAVDGDPVDQQRTLRERLLAYDEGEVVTLTVLRGGEELSVDVTLGPNSGGFGFGFGPGMGGDGGMFFFGPGGMDKDFMRHHPFFFGQGGDSGSAPSENMPSNNTGDASGSNA